MSAETPFIRRRALLSLLSRCQRVIAACVSSIALVYLIIIEQLVLNSATLLSRVLASNHLMTPRWATARRKLVRDEIRSLVLLIDSLISV